MFGASQNGSSSRHVFITEPASSPVTRGILPPFHHSTPPPCSARTGGGEAGTGRGPSPFPVAPPHRGRALRTNQIVKEQCGPHPGTCPAEAGAGPIGGHSEPGRPGRVQDLAESPGTSAGSQALARPPAAGGIPCGRAPPVPPAPARRERRGPSVRAHRHDASRMDGQILRDGCSPSLFQLSRARLAALPGG